MKNCGLTTNFLKERKIKHQYVDSARYGLSKGVLQSVKNAVGLDNLVDYEGEEYKTRGLRYYNKGIVAAWRIQGAATSKDEEDAPVSDLRCCGR